MSALTEALNRKIIATALLTTKICQVPLTTQCRFRSASFYGMPACCDHDLDNISIKMAISLTERLHTLVRSADAGLESRDLFDDRDFAHQVNVIAQCMLCDKHRSAANAKDLAGKYMHAIHMVALAEQSNIESLATTICQKHTEKVNRELQSRQNRPKHRRYTSDIHVEDCSASPPGFDTWTSPQTGEGCPAQGDAQASPTPQPRGGRPQSLPYKTVLPLNDENGEHVAPSRSGDPVGVFDEWLEGHLNVTPKPPPSAVKTVINLYEDRWKAEEPFKAIDCSIAEVMRRIPWPMLQQKTDGVDEQGVYAFYCAATREVTRNCRDFFAKEKLKWHPDRIDYKFAGVKGVEELKKQATIIFRVLCIVEIKYKEQLQSKGPRFWGVDFEGYVEIE